MTENIDPCPTCLRTGMLLEIAADDEHFLMSIEMNEDTGLIEFLLNCNDTFGYACADAETVPFEEAEAVYTAYKAHGNHGLVVWAAGKRGIKPVVEICEDMERAGVQLPDGLDDNPSNVGGYRWRKAKTG